MRKGLHLIFLSVLGFLAADVHPGERNFPPPARELTIDGATVTKVDEERAPEHLYVRDEANVPAENLSLVSGTASGRSILAVSGGAAQLVSVTEDAETTIDGAAFVENVFLSGQSGAIVRGKSVVRSLSLSGEAEAVVLDAGLGLITLDDSARLQIITPIVQPAEGKISFPGLEIEGGAVVLNSELASITSPAQSVSYCDGLVSFRKAWGPPIQFKAVVCGPNNCAIPKTLPDQVRVDPPPLRPPPEGQRLEQSC